MYCSVNGDIVALSVGASTDPAGITMVDSIKVYTRTKEAFSWPEDSEQLTTDSGPSKPQTPASDTVVGASGVSPLMPVDRQVLKCCQNLCVLFTVDMITNLLFNKTKKKVYISLFICLLCVCTTFHCIWTNSFKVTCTMVSAIKSKMETRRGTTLFTSFFISVHTYHNKYAIKWVGWKMSKSNKTLTSILKSIFDVPISRVCFNSGWCDWYRLMFQFWLMWLIQIDVSILVDVIDTDWCFNSGWCDWYRLMFQFWLMWLIQIDVSILVDVIDTDWCFNSGWCDWYRLMFQFWLMWLIQIDVSILVDVIDTDWCFNSGWCDWYRLMFQFWLMWLIQIDVSILVDVIDTDWCFNSGWCDWYRCDWYRLMFQFWLTWLIQIDVSILVDVIDTDWCFNSGRWLIQIDVSILVDVIDTDYWQAAWRYWMDASCSLVTRKRRYVLFLCYRWCDWYRLMFQFWLMWLIQIDVSILVDVIITKERLYTL